MAVKATIETTAEATAVATRQWPPFIAMDQLPLHHLGPFQSLNQIRTENSVDGDGLDEQGSAFESFQGHPRVYGRERYRRNTKEAFKRDRVYKIGDG